MAAFNLNNFKKTSTMQQMKYMLQEFNKLAMAQFDKMELSMKEKADLVAFSLKNYQKEGVFANVDSAIFYVQENLVREPLRNNSINFLIQMKLDLIETRSFAVPRSRIGHWTEQLGFPAGLEVETTPRAERSITSDSSTATAEVAQPSIRAETAQQAEGNAGQGSTESEEGPHSGPLFGSMTSNESKLM